MCRMSLREIDAAATRQAEVEYLSEQEQLKTAALEMALAEMQASA
jgi:hypothetical protein